MNECTAHDGSREFTRPMVRDGFQSSDRYGFELVDPEWRLLDQLNEARHSHLVEPSSDFAEFRRTVCLEIRPPASQRCLGEEKVREGKHREQMSAERVIPGWPKRGDHLTCRLQQRRHDPQNLCGIAEVFEAVDTDDDIGRL